MGAAAVRGGGGARPEMPSHANRRWAWRRDGGMGRSLLCRLEEDAPRAPTPRALAPSTATSSAAASTALPDAASRHPRCSRLRQIRPLVAEVTTARHCLRRAVFSVGRARPRAVAAGAELAPRAPTPRALVQISATSSVARPDAVSRRPQRSRLSEIRPRVAEVAPASFAAACAVPSHRLEPLALCAGAGHATRRLAQARRLRPRRSFPWPQREGAQRLPRPRCTSAVTRRLPGPWRAGRRWLPQPR